MCSKRPTFSIGTVPVNGDLILAPMRGFSDLPYRSICRSMGSAISYTSFIGAIGILTNDKDSWRALSFLPEERPVAFQIYDNDEERLLMAARQIQRLNPDVIDINMGCSIRGISGRGAGAGLLRDAEKIGEIVKKMSTELDLPISAKIRLGWDHQSKNYIDVARTIEDHGGALIAVHARTRDQGLSGNADWDAIAEIKDAVNIPVIGNGDVRSVEDIDQLIAHTGCDAVMIGRAARGYPWIFQRRKLKDVPFKEVAATIHLHLDKMIDFYGQKHGILRFRKHLAAYIKPMQVPKSIRIVMLSCTERSQLNSLLKDIGLEIVKET